VRLNHGRRTKSISICEDSDIKEEPSDLYMSETPPPLDAIPVTTTSPLQPVISTTTTVNDVSTINVKLYILEGMLKSWNY